jgi:predicted lipoprotein with Yx(FWY)xxD motif
MRRPIKIFLALSLAIGAAGFGVAVAEGSHSGSTSVTPAAQGAVAGPSGSATIGVEAATVLGQSEQILVDAHGLPLYTYNLDTASQSQVSAGVAQAWPPLLSGSPTENGATGRLGVVTNANGQQVQYNGHFLYTFVKDIAGRVTGQGIQGFFVAAPTLGASSSQGTATTAPPAATQNNPYHY